MPYRIDQINQQLRGEGCTFRAIEQIEHTPETTLWLSTPGLIAGGIIWIRDTLERFLLLPNGQLFPAKNADLASLSEIDKVNIRFALTGEITDDAIPGN